jgi:DNA-binding SARP family transcriptional activator/streptogramin lyase
MLGPLEVWKDGQPLRLGGDRQRALLAFLLLHANVVVSTDRLIDELFDPATPETAENGVHVAVSRLRRLLEDASDEPRVVLTRPRGYELHLAPDQLDIARFEQRVAEGRRALEDGDAASASTLLGDALTLWRGPALADLSQLDFVQSDVRRLEALRIAAVEDRIEADLAVGRSGELVPELEALVTANPLEERLRGQLMLALYRSGRQADALEVYRQTRSLLHDELGLEPSRTLQQLQRSILEHDPGLASRTPMTRPESGRGRRPRRRWAYVGTAVAVAAAAVAVAVGFRVHRQGDVVVEPGTIIRIDARSNRIVQSTPVGREPAAVLASDDAVWVASERDSTLSRVDLRTGKAHSIGGVEKPAFLTRDVRGNVYASAWDHPFVWRIDPITDEVVHRYRVRTRALDMAVDGGSLWVVDRLVNAVDRIDLARGTVRNVIPVGTDPLVLASGYGAIWVANSDDWTVSVIRPGVPRPQTIAGIVKPLGIAAGEGAIWVGNNGTSTVTKIDPDTRRKVAEIDIVDHRSTTPSDLYDVEVGAGSVWAVDRGAHTLVRIDPDTNKVIARIELPEGTEPRSIAVNGEAIWLSVGTPGYGG